MIARSDEVGTALEIDRIYWHHTGTGDTTAVFTDFDMYLAYCPNDVLCTTFDDNYVPGSKTLVFHRDLLEVTAYMDDWFSLDLDVPFWYDGEGNLLLEICWAGGSGSVQNYLFDTPMTPCRLKAPDPEGQTGFLGSMRCQFMLEGALTLQQESFGRIKVVLGDPLP